MSNFCINCGHQIEGEVNFCPQCGHKKGASLVKPISKLSLPKIFSVLSLSAVLFVAGWCIKESKAGTPPGQHFQGNQHSANTSPQKNEDYNDPVLEALRAKSKSSPQDLAALKEFTGALIEKIRATDSPPSGLVFETIDSLRAILEIDPKDANALIAMADISFDQQAFAKAVQFYQRFLEVEPEDVNARARYASSLTFTNQFDKALAELQQAAQKDPKNFHVKAYTAIVYAQMGKMDQAKAAAIIALELAPNEEAKQRFRQFIESLEKPTPNSPQASAATSEPAVVAFIRNNPIASSKFDSYEMLDTSTLVLKFHDFPMEMMPPFAKDKFINGLKAAANAAGSNDIKRIIFRDTPSGKELSKVDLP